jgi:hypothetical protein
LRCTYIPALHCTGAISFSLSGGRITGASHTYDEKIARGWQLRDCESYAVAQTLMLFLYGRHIQFLGPWIYC